MKIALWKKDSGNYMSHSKGLTKEQVEALQQLKEGDRFIVFTNEKQNEFTPDLTLQVYLNQRK